MAKILDICIILVLAILAAMALSSCSWSQQTRERTTETNRVTGTVAGAPVELVHQRQTDRAEEVEGTRDSGLAEVGQVIGAAAPAVAGPLGIAGTLLGVVTTAAAGLAAIRRGKERDIAERHRNEIIDGIERSKAKLSSYGGAWDTLTESLEAEQSRDTVKAIKERVG